MISRAFRRLGLLASILLPFAAYQIVAPRPLTRTVLEDLSGAFYTSVLRLVPPPDLAPSPVVMIEVDQKTVDALGWPIARENYARLFAKLTASGRPWILSLVNFQKTEAAADEMLVKHLRDYARVVGTSLELTAGESLAADEADLVAAKASLGLNPELLGDVPLAFKESPLFAAAAERFGIGARFGTENVVLCMPPYVDDARHRGDVVLPTAALWAASLWAGRGFRLQNGLEWEPAGAREPLMPVAGKLCLSRPEMSTRRFFDWRKLNVLSMIDVLAQPPDRKLGARLVVLAKSDMRPFAGPGAVGGDDGVVTEGRLLARFIDDITTQQALARPTADDRRWPKAVALCLTFVLIAVVFRPRIGAALCLAVIGALLGLAAWRLVSRQVFVSPLPDVAGLAFALVSYIVVATLFEHSARLRLGRAQTAVRTNAARCNSVDELAAAVSTALRASLGGGQCRFARFDTKLHAAADSTDLVEVRQSDDVQRTLAAAELGAWKLQADPPRGDRMAEFIDTRTLHLTGFGQFLRGDKRRASVELILPEVDASPKRGRAFLRDLLVELLIHWQRIEAVQLKNLSNLLTLAMSEELRLGKAVQALTLPSPLAGRFGAWDYLFHFNPYGALAGDWAQAFIDERDGVVDDVAVLAIGDVVGKGTSASLLTSAIAAVWSKFTSSPIGAPALDAFVFDLDTMIRRLFKGTQFSTLSIACIMGGSVRVWACAAPLWLVVSPNGTVKRIRTLPANPLGVSSRGPKPRFVDAQVDVGDILLSYTDGVIDGSVALQRFEVLVKANPPRADAAYFDELVAMAKEAGQRDALPDDQTILILRRGPPA